MADNEILTRVGVTLTKDERLRAGVLLAIALPIVIIALAIQRDAISLPAMNTVWDNYKADREHIAPLLTFSTGLLTFVAGSIVAYAALKQARIARLRHEEQTKADLQRRITESFTKAVEQLGSDKIQVRLGGIYTLERISRESELDYWPIMETLTAFVRERAPWKSDDGNAPATFVNLVKDDAPQEPRSRPPTDVAAVLTVIVRRDSRDREREKANGWRLDLRLADLRRAFLEGAHLEGAFLVEAHLEGANLNGAHLEGAFLVGAHLEGAFLVEAHLEGANLYEAHLEGANLIWAHLEEADLYGAHLEKARLEGARLEGAKLIGAHLEGAVLEWTHLEEARLNGAHLEGANLRSAHLEKARLNGARLEGAKLIGAHLEGASLRGAAGLRQDDINGAYGNSETHLPEGFARPDHWSE